MPVAGASADDPAGDDPARAIAPDGTAARAVAPDEALARLIASDDASVGLIAPDEASARLIAPEEASARSVAPDEASARSAPEEASARLISELRARLEEAEETLAAIRNGDVDAVVVGSAQGQLVYTLENADRPYRVLIEQMQEGAVTLADDGTILYCNERFAHLVAMAREAIVGCDVQRFVRADEAAAFARMVLDDDRKSRAAEFSLRAADGQDIPVNVSLVDLQIEGDLSRVICAVVTDLTLNRQRSGELAAANRLLEQEIGERRRIEESLMLALDAAEMGNWEMDLVTGRTRRSRRHDEIFGYPESLPHWSVDDALRHFVSEDRDPFRQAIAETQARGTLAFVGRIERADDQVLRWVDIRGRVFGDGTAAVRIAGVIADVTERRALEEQLRQAQKMEAVGQLTGGLAHDFNNLLTGISGSLELLGLRIAQGRTGAELERYIGAAQGASRRAAALTHRLLAFARRQTLDPQATDVNRLIREMEELLRRTIGPGCVLAFEADPALWTALVDGNQLESAVLNLCINARDAMPDGGRIVIRTQNVHIDALAAAEREVASGEYLAISVTDTGTGMTPEIVARAFDPFFTTKPIGVGTGLGLSMVYGFARQSSGEVLIRSTVGAGTSMAIHLPRYSGVLAADAAPEPGLEALQSERHETVCVVDDEPTVRMLVMEVLADLGYHALEASDGPSALKILQSSQRIDLLITDVGLPGGINGRQVADAARIGRPELGVLFITGYADHAVLEKGDLGNGMQTLTKPFTIETLARRIKTMVATSG